ncbi:hypothetical protein CSHISOI_09836, partial [Colletotrichum shisoi]
NTSVPKTTASAVVAEKPAEPRAVVASTAARARNGYSLRRRPGQGDREEPWTAFGGAVSETGCGGEVFDIARSE